MAYALKGAHLHALIVVTVLVLSGCGGGGGGEPAAVSGPSTVQPPVSQVNPPTTSVEGDTGTGSGSGGAGQGDGGSSGNAGGSGSGSGGSSSPADPEPPLPDLTSAQALAIDRATLTAATQLGGDARALVDASSVMLDLSRDASTHRYEVTLSGGSLEGNRFYGNLALQTVTAGPAVTAHKLIDSHRVNLHKAYGTVGAHRFAVVLQTLGDPQGTYSGMGNWKYMGDTQNGYFSGTKVATGSFLFGIPTASAQLDGIGSASYAGYAQAEAEATLVGPFVMDDDLNQLTADVSVVVDRAASTATITLTNFRYWRNYGMSNLDMAMFMSADGGGYLPETLGCTAPLTAGQEVFSCDVGGVHATTGKLQGRFFGPEGEEFSGTFAFKGLFLSGVNETAVGAFISRK